jgi:hypothetical protein
VFITGNVQRGYISTNEIYLHHIAKPLLKTGKHE